jgi:hypothetical protein
MALAKPLLLTLEALAGWLEAKVPAWAAPWLELKKALPEASSHRLRRKKRDALLGA